MNRILTLLAIIILLSSCETNSAQTGIISKTLDAGSFKDSIQKKVNHQLLDVRSPEEYAGGHLKDAINIDYDGKDFAAMVQKLDKNLPTFVYCLSGGRSTGAKNFLLKNGFTEVYDLSGGLMKWNALKLPLETHKPASNEWIGMTLAEYETLCKSEIPILFDFKAKWCGPCKQLTPILNEIEREYSGKIKIVPIDIDENKSLANGLKINSIPFLIFYKNGKHTMNIDGLSSKENLIQTLGLKK